jgi:hypothetical protein
MIRNRGPNNQHSYSYIDDPHKALATAVIMNAIHDRRRKRAEITLFFQSDWFEVLAELAMIDPYVARQELGVPPVKARVIV